MYGKRGGAAAKKEFAPDVAIGYIKTSKNPNPKTGKKTTYLSVMVRAEELEKLPVKDGIIYLSAFRIENKKSDKTPDYKFISSAVDGSTAAKPAAVKPAASNDDDSSPF